MKIEIIKPRMTDPGRKELLYGVIRLDGWLSFSFKLYETSKGPWVKLGDSYKNKSGEWRDVLFYTKGSSEYKQIVEEVMAAYSREKNTMTYKEVPQEITVEKTPVYTAEDIPF
jgi:DNA-binding cell septation regulator SpoVG